MFHKRFSVMNMSYSGQQLFSYSKSGAHTCGVS